MLFVWDEHNVEHVGRHGVTADEVEEAMLDARRLVMPAYNVEGERRFAILGATEAGRLLFVVYTKRDKCIRVITAREAAYLKRRYNKG